MSDPYTDLDRFYALLTGLEALEAQGLRLDEITSQSAFPLRGVYFIREPGEYRSPEPRSPRIVRVGTHALNANEKSTLLQRLKAHRGTAGGKGNHRGSVFRKHVGAALLARDGTVAPTWGKGQSAPAALRASATAQAAEAACERMVSDHIGAMTVLWVDVPDEPGPDSMRAFIEQNAIALLSNRFSPADPPSSGWLGHHSPQYHIQRSGLWNVRHADESYNPRFLDELEAAVEWTLGRQASNC